MQILIGGTVFRYLHISARERTLIHTYNQYILYNEGNILFSMTTKFPTFYICVVSPENKIYINMLWPFCQRTQTQNYMHFIYFSFRSFTSEYFGSEYYRDDWKWENKFFRPFRLSFHWYTTDILFFLANLWPLLRLMAVNPGGRICIGLLCLWII